MRGEIDYGFIVTERIFADKHRLWHAPVMHIQIQL